MGDSVVTFTLPSRELGDLVMDLFQIFAQATPTVPTEVTSWAQIVTNLGFGGIVAYLLVWYLPNLTREHQAELQLMRQDQSEERESCASERKEIYRVVNDLRESIEALTEEIRKNR